jgi:hypothetical protein
MVRTSLVAEVLTKASLVAEALTKATLSAGFDFLHVNEVSCPTGYINIPFPCSRRVAGMVQGLAFC